MTEYGIQMYSLRDVTSKDLKEGLRQVAHMGYKLVEFAGFFGNSAEQVKRWLEEYGLTPIGSHIGLSSLSESEIEKTVAYHKAIGCKNLIVPAADWSTEAMLDANISDLKRASVKLAEEGLALGYHNHSDEYFIAPYGKVVMNEILGRTDLFLEVDTFWLYNAGIDPVSYLDENKSRISLIHLKDGITSKGDGIGFGNSQSGAIDKSIGMGEAPVREIREWAIANAVPIVIESEGLDPTGPEEVWRCIDYLRTLEA